MVKNLLVMRETQVQSLGREEPLEKGMATHSSILAWKIPWTKEAGGLQFMGLQRVLNVTEHAQMHIHSFMILSKKKPFTLEIQIDKIILF